MPTPARWREDYDPDYDLMERYDPSDEREPPDDSEPEDNIPDAVMDRLAWDAATITNIEDQLERDAHSRDYAEEAYWREFTDE